MRGQVGSSLGCVGCLAVLVAACVGQAGGASDTTPTANALTRARHQLYFPIGDDSKHAQTQCAECHADANSFLTFTCQSCHAHAPDVAPTRHVYITGFENVSNACYNCHPTGWEAPILPADHSLKYFPIQSGSHNDLVCKSCHPDGSTSKVYVCVTCHGDATSAAQHTTVSGYAWTDAGCFGCHPQDK